MPKPTAKPEISPWQVLESLGEAVAVVDRNMTVVWINDSLLEKYYPGLQPMGQPCYKALAQRGDICPEATCPVIPVFASGKPFSVEKHMTTPDGKEIWREARAYPIFDGRGRVAFAARISFDITHRKKKEYRQERDIENMERSLEEMSRITLEHLPFQPSGPSLSPRELEVLRLMSQGLAKRQIADVLGISLNTVKRHVSNIFNKLAVNDRAQAAVWAARNHLV
jgi:DNA-binding CsgD family transcriptional regulator